MTLNIEEFTFKKFWMRSINELEMDEEFSCDLMEETLTKYPYFTN